VRTKILANHRLAMLCIAWKRKPKWFVDLLVLVSEEASLLVIGEITEKAVYGRSVRTVYESRASWQQLNLTL